MSCTWNFANLFECSSKYCNASVLFYKFESYYSTKTSIWGNLTKPHSFAEVMPQGRYIYIYIYIRYIYILFTSFFKQLLAVYWRNHLKKIGINWRRALIVPKLIEFRPRVDVWKAAWHLLLLLKECLLNLIHFRKWGTVSRGRGVWGWLTKTSRSPNNPTPSPSLCGGTGARFHPRTK